MRRAPIDIALCSSALAACSCSCQSLKAALAPRVVQCATACCSIARSACPSSTAHTQVFQLRTCTCHASGQLSHFEGMNCCVSELLSLLPSSMLQDLFKYFTKLILNRLDVRPHGMAADTPSKS